jgi:hypothetical protein
MKVLSDGRVRRTAREWEKIMARHGKSDMSVAAFCEKEEISRSAFNTWRRVLSSDRKKRPSFVEVTPSVMKSPVPPAARSPETVFELAFPGGVTLRWKG